MAHKRNRSRDKPQTRKLHPDRYEADLNPNHMAGQNIGARAPEEKPRVRAASNIKEMTRVLADFDEDELREIPVLEPGARLEQGATYVDLRDPSRRPFTAVGGMHAGPSNCYVPRAAVPYAYWNRLIGYVDPRRTR